MKIIENGESLTKVNTGLAYSFDAMVAEIAPKLFFRSAIFFKLKKKKIFQRTIVFEKGQKSGEITGGNFGLQTSCSLAIEPKDKADMEINFVPDNQTAELEKFEGEIDKLERDSGFHSILQAHNRVKPKDKQIVFLAEITGFNSVTSAFRQVDRNQNTP